MKIRGREYVDYDEYLDTKQEYRLDAMREKAEEDGWSICDRCGRDVEIVEEGYCQRCLDELKQEGELGEED